MKNKLRDKIYQDVIKDINKIDIRKNDRQSFCDFIQLRGYLNNCEDKNEDEIVFDLIYKNVFRPGYKKMYKKELKC